MACIRDILHVDMDAFFASVEQVLDPDLAGRAVIVGGHVDDRSVVASASYQARRYGVHSAMPLARARRLCPGAVFVRGDFHAYGEYSDRVREILCRFAPVVQAVSLDDFYLDLTGCRRLHGPPLVAAEAIREAVRAETGLEVSIGVAVNRLVAKVAGGLAKPSGILEVWRGCETGFFRPLPVEKLPGVGASTTEALHRFNLVTLGDVARMPRKLLERTFGVWGALLWERAHGRDDSPVTDADRLPRSISREHTFQQDTMDHTEVRAMLYHLAERAARQLREEGLLAGRVTVKVRYCDFRTVTSAARLSAPTDQDSVFYEAALGRLERLMARRLQVRLIGVALTGFADLGGHQGDLFAQRALERRRRFYRGLDRLRDRFGFQIAAVGPALRMKAEN